MSVNTNNPKWCVFSDANCFHVFPNEDHYRAVAAAAFMTEHGHNGIHIRQLPYAYRKSFSSIYEHLTHELRYAMRYSLYGKDFERYCRIRAFSP